MSKRNKILITASAILLVLIIGAVLWFSGRAPLLRPSVPAGPTIGGLPAPDVESPVLASPIEVPATEASLQAIVRTFVERYGSYSTDAPYDNVKQVTALVTSRFLSSLPPQQDISNDNYFGVTTLLLSSSINSYDEAAGRASVSVDTQRLENRGSSRNQTVAYQGIDLVLVRVGTDWKVDSVIWENN